MRPKFDRLLRESLSFEVDFVNFMCCTCLTPEPNTKLQRSYAVAQDSERPTPGSMIWRHCAVADPRGNLVYNENCTFDSA